MYLKQILAVVIGLFTLTATIQADTLNMKSIGAEPPNSSMGVPRPSRGMTMDQVLQKFGEPQQKIPAVGNPPITRWVYEKFTVYFEHQYTLHSVVHHK